MKRTILSLAIAACTCASALAQSPETPKDQGPLVELPPHIAEGVTPEQMKAAEEMGSQVIQDMLGAYRKATPEQTKVAEDARRRADSIADETMQAERDSVLEFLGIDPDAEAGLYVFVSWSMPLEMLRSYSIEAMWSGGTLVFRGLPPGEDPASFITQKLKNLVYGKGAAANISIDPRLFDAYQVTSVPTVVFTKVRQDMQCQGVERVPVALPDGKSAMYDKCPALDPAEYWKVSGGVTMNYALQSFIDDGAKTAQPYLDALARGWSQGKVPGKVQSPFVGEWKDVLSPSEQKAARQATETLIPTAVEGRATPPR